MGRKFVDVNGVKTRLLMYGSNVNSELILVIPGNPGVTGFYKTFLQALNEKTGIPVWIISHAGHEIPPERDDSGDFGLQAQVEHKKAFIRNFVPEQTKLHLVGHSIGAYMVLNLLKEEWIKEKVIHSHLLFPTFEFMATTPNGKFLTTFVRPIVWLLVFLSWFFTILPSFIQRALRFLYSYYILSSAHIPNCFIDADVISRVFAMAFEEMDQVLDRPQTLQENVDRINLLYGKTDGWVPINYYKKLKEDIVGIKAELYDFDHAFVIKHSVDVANVVAEWICK